ncbi:alpha/beta hydrolase [Pseudoalteromonas sp. NBT06-2]|uniref:alpha/beta fold hydrolase n=1 Tax=Pseudoalteromonas sp. NBT06-2 TaxID=2025950 RepID=UPI000BA56B68|nr:alpha/beta fold hydrolase [Pseudoalteromonas sp. NBT06-2]PAJ74450.1 alpha/beta hydrolase [Pseudoalteromonas sp. NBT06-2]
MKINWKNNFLLTKLLISMVLICSLFISIAVAEQKILNIKHCHLKGIKEQVKCGSLQVPENYQKLNGTKISINFAILPAIDSSQNKEPLMFLAGGPGQAAVELAAGLKIAFKEIHKTRDILLIDQRGTGESHALKCLGFSEQDPYLTIPEEFSDEQIKTCISRLSGDLSQYNSENAIRDFDAVRQVLGHKKVNLYGGSYGTRAGLVYMRLFPDSIRSVVLDSVGPIEVPIGLFGQSAARSFTLLLKHCQQESACNTAYPNLAQEFDMLITRLEKTPVALNIPHPRSGNNTNILISKGKLISHLQFKLYSVSGRSLVPLIIHQAYLGNYLPVAGLISESETGVNMNLGLTFNILCNEDFSKITSDMLKLDAHNNFAGKFSNSIFKQACSLWPKYQVKDDFYQSVTANIPTLILSGGLDPVTPPSNGEYTRKTLPNSHHIIVDNVSHGVATSTCAALIINEFLTSLAPKKLDESCLENVPKESFMTSLNGGA